MDKLIRLFKRLVFEKNTCKEKIRLICVLIRLLKKLFKKLIKFLYNYRYDGENGQPTIPWYRTPWFPKTMFIKRFKPLDQTNKALAAPFILKSSFFKKPPGSIYLEEMAKIKMKNLNTKDLRTAEKKLLRVLLKTRVSRSVNNSKIID